MATNFLDSENLSTLRLEELSVHAIHPRHPSQSKTAPTLCRSCADTPATLQVFIQLRNTASSSPSMCLNANDFLCGDCYTTLMKRMLEMSLVRSNPHSQDTNNTSDSSSGSSEENLASRPKTHQK